MKEGGRGLGDVILGDVILSVLNLEKEAMSCRMQIDSTLEKGGKKEVLIFFFLELPEEFTADTLSPVRSASDY